MTDYIRTIAIVGGGIGGLTSALALAKVGFECVVLERQASGAHVGAGIQLTPNATRVLFGLGLELDLSVIATQPQAMHWLDGSNDDLLSQFPLGAKVENQYGAPYLQLHRSDLIHVLATACRESNNIELVNGTLVERIDVSSSQVRISSHAGIFRADVCIGADGTNSTVRRYAQENIRNRKFTGCAYRALIPLEHLNQHFAEPVIRVWLHPRFHVVTYPIGVKPRLNCVVVVDGEHEHNHNDLHRQKASLSELRKSLETFSPRLQALLAFVDDDSLFKWPLYQFGPARSNVNTHGRLALVGDSWHTTVPFAAQGAALAIEDAVALANSIRGATTSALPSGLAQYEKHRIPRIRRVQRISSRNKTIYHLHSPILRQIRNWSAQVGYQWTTKRLFEFGKYPRN